MSCAKRLLKEMKQYHTFSVVEAGVLMFGGRGFWEQVYWRDGKAAVVTPSCLRRTSSEFWLSDIRLPSLASKNIYGENP